jgi:hypothetical protein
LTHHTLFGLLVHYVQKEAGHAFFHRIRDQDMKQQLLMGGERTLSKALSKSFQQEAIKIAAGMFVRLQQMSTRTM